MLFLCELLKAVACQERIKNRVEIEKTQTLRFGKKALIEYLAQGRYTIETLRTTRQSRAIVGQSERITGFSKAG